jgi:uncharacterized protein with von Willebrand factor type A (vWA) domain
MPDAIELPPSQGPDHLAENVMHFGRVLRQAGVGVTTDRIGLALRALSSGGIERRDDFKATLSACMIDRPEHVAMFEQAFYVFWRDPDLMARIMAMLLPKVQAKSQVAPPPENKRLAAALFGAGAKPREAAPPPDQIELDASLTFSQQEILRKADFETMSDAEWLETKRMMRSLVPRIRRQKTRRLMAAAKGRVPDWRASLKSEARAGEAALLRFRKPRSVPVRLVVLADISGSMSKYSRMLLHFTHALSMAGLPVASFVFGTRLSSITRQLRQRDPDVAVAAVVRQVEDWSGGTRMTECMHAFNRDWSRRLLAQRATVILISDGLEHGDVSQLAGEMERLSKSSESLIWLNPLLRYQAFEPRAAGIKAILPYVDRFMPAHNLNSLEALADVLGGALSGRAIPAATRS